MDNGEALIFILDIGTRSVTGIAGRQAGDLFEVAAWHPLPHPRRAMIDGQIEDIEQVAKVAGMVKARMEEKLGAAYAYAMQWVEQNGYRIVSGGTDTKNSKPFSWARVETMSTTFCSTSARWNFSVSISILPASIFVPVIACSVSKILGIL